MEWLCAIYGRGMSEVQAMQNGTRVMKFLKFCRSLKLCGIFFAHLCFLLQNFIHASAVLLTIPVGENILKCQSDKSESETAMLFITQHHHQSLMERV